MKHFDFKDSWFCIISWCCRLLKRPFHSFSYHLAWVVNAVKIAVYVWEKLKLRCILLVTGARYPTEDFLVKFGEHRFADRRWIAAVIQMSLNFQDLWIPYRFCRQMYGKMKTVSAAFLVRLFPPNTISKFFYLVSLVLNS